MPTIGIHVEALPGEVMNGGGVLPFNHSGCTGVQIQSLNDQIGKGYGVSWVYNGDA
ncbi:MAG TPA: hypothetical protein VHR66_26005 [Gemmataceae bacterium]|jgi:hypothetical protein|nr:hypothetical protein [Gemmataceae bacterium]